MATLSRLEINNSLDERDFEALNEGYALLRSVDHYLRLIVGRVATLPSIDHSESGEIAAKLGFRNAVELHEALTERMQAIRATYDRITE
jgi:glutamine synthetase adenylyltransferase